MKVLLIQPPHIGERTFRRPDFVPLGLGYLARVLADHAVDVHMLDIWGRGLSKPETEAFLKQNTFDIFGIGGLSTQWSYIDWLSGKIKSIHNKPIILGGALATFSYKEVLEELDVDVCVLGEGEETFLDCLRTIQSDSELEDVEGVAFLNGDGVTVTNKREYITKLDDIPYPQYELFNMDSYISNCSVYSKYGSYNHIPAINMVTGRGCPYSCNFCSKIFEGARYRSIDNVIEELKYLKSTYGIKGVFFNDELVLSSKRRGMELSEKIASLDLIWNCQGRINTVDRELLKYMKEAGCVSLGYGIESGSQHILGLMNKKQNAEEIVNALNMTVEVGIEPIPQWMFGYPGEDERSVKETKSTLSRINFPMNPSFIFTPLPGTQIFDRAIKDGLIKDKIEYYKKLSDGYDPRNPYFINFTKWPEQKFLKTKRRLQKSIFSILILRSLFNLEIFPVVYRDLSFRIKNMVLRGPSLLLRKMHRLVSKENLK